MVALLRVLAHMATCSVGEVRFSEPHETCLQGVESLLGV